MRFSPHTAPRSILSKSLDPFPRSRIPPLFHSVPKSNQDQFSHVFMFQLNTFHFGLFSNSKEKIILFTKHMRIQSRSYNKNKRSFSINPFAPHSSRMRKILFKFEFVHLGSGFFYIYLVYLFSFYLFLLNIFPSLFLYHSLSPIGLILQNLTHFLIERRVRNK